MQNQHWLFEDLIKWLVDENMLSAGILLTFFYRLLVPMYKSANQQIYKFNVSQNVIQKDGGLNLIVQVYAILEKKTENLEIA